MSLTYPTDPSLPANPTPLFSDTAAARGDHLRANNAEIWGNFASLQSSKIEVISSSLADAIALFDGATGKIIKDSGVKIALDFSNKLDTYIATVKATSDYIDSMFPVGFMIDDTGITPPTGGFWMSGNGDSLIRASYPTLWSRYNAVIGTCTISQAAPAIIYIVGHGLQSGDCVAIVSTGTPPAPITVETKYYVTRVDADNLKFSTTYANYLAGVFVNTTNAGSGVHTLRYNPWGIADATHFNLPDTRGLVTVGSGTPSASIMDWAGVNYMERLAQYKQDQAQGWQLGAVADSAGSRNYYGITDTRDEAAAAASVSNYTRAQLATTAQGSSQKIYGVSDGVNDAPRYGKITSIARVGANKLVRVL